MKSFFDKFEKEQKFNLFVGDFLNKISGYPTRTDISEAILSEIKSSAKGYIKDLNSFSDIVQAYLDAVIDTKKNLIKQIKENFEYRYNTNLDTYNNIINSKSEEEQKVKDDEFQEVLKVLQDRLGRVLTPLEIDKVSSWFDDDIDKDLIIKVIDSLMAKRGKISSLNVIDKALAKEISHQDVLDEGFTSVDSTSKKNIKDALEIASYDWVKKDE